MSALILVGDVGGTNTRLKLYEVSPYEKTSATGTPPGTLVKHVEYENSKYEQFIDVVKAFLAAEPPTVRPPAAGCLAVAGPVESNRVHFTNRNWTM